MLTFDPLKYAYPSHRNVVYANRGMTASTSPIASQVGIDAMKAGGNAIDALASQTGLPVLAKLPIDPALADAVDKGEIENSPNYLDEVAQIIEGVYAE